MRIAIAANRVSGGGLDPEPFAAAMRGAEVRVFEGLDGVAEWGPDRLAVAGGDGTVAPAAALDELRAAGLRLIDEEPRTGIRGSRVAFLHPSASGGVLTELVQPSNVATDGDDRRQGADRMKARGIPA